MSVAAPDRPLVGAQEPRILSVPAYASSAGADAAELAASAGLILDPWQRLVLDRALGETAEGRWAAFEVGVLVSRQNGKGSILEARELAGLFLFGERLIVHSAHEFKTAREAFLRIKDLIDGTRDFRRRVKRVTNNTFEVCIELITGQRLIFVARSKGSGRGFTGDVVILDEAFNLPDEVMEALMPTMSAKPNPQLWYTSSAPDKNIAPCLPLTRVRNRGMKGADPDLAYFEWSAQLCGEECPAGCKDHDDPADPLVWAATNPGMGIRISQDYIRKEHGTLRPRGFSRERLGVGDYPSESADQWQVVPEALWRSLADAASQAGERIAFAIAVARGGSHAAIAAVGVREDGLWHGEVIDYRPGTSWVVDRAFQLRDDWDPAAFVVDPGSPSGFLIAELEADCEDGTAGIVITKTKTRDVTAAYGAMVEALGVAEEDEPTFRYVPHPALDAAVAGATTRKIGEALTWDSLSPSVDISPLRAMTLARFGLATYVEEEPLMPLGAVR